MTNRPTRLANLPKGALPLALLLALPLNAAQARPTAKPGPQAIGPKPDDPGRGAKPSQVVPKADPRKEGLKR